MYPIIWHGVGGKPNNIKSPFFFLTVVLVLVLVLTIVLVTVLSL